MTTPTDTQIQEATKLYISLLNDGYRDGQGIADLARLIAARDENAKLRKDKERLENVRLAALNMVGICVGAIPQVEIDAGRIQHAFILSAHRILATGQPDGILKSEIIDSAMNKEKK